MYVYIISDGDSYKIGVTNCLEKRLSSLQTGNPRRLFVYRFIEVESDDEAYRIENNLHRIFDDYRLEGEWFSSGIKDELDSMSDDFIVNYKPPIHSDRLCLYEIWSSVYDTKILNRWPLEYDEDGLLTYVDLRKKTKKNKEELQGILNRLDQDDINVIYTLNQDKVDDYIKIQVQRSIKRVSDYVDKYKDVIEKKEKLIRRFKLEYDNFLEEN